MADKIFETIIYTKMITKKKPSTDRIETHLQQVMKTTGVRQKIWKLYSI